MLEDRVWLSGGRLVVSHKGEVCLVTTVVGTECNKSRQTQNNFRGKPKGPELLVSPDGTQDPCLSTLADPRVVVSRWRSFSHDLNPSSRFYITHFLLQNAAKCSPKSLNGQVARSPARPTPQQEPVRSHPSDLYLLVFQISNFNSKFNFFGWQL